MDLRGALFAAMAAGGPSKINFACSAPPCTIVLGAPLPPIFEATANTGATAPSSFSLTINGESEGLVVLDGNSLGTNTTPDALKTNRVFFVDNVTVSLKDLVIQNATGQGGAGGFAAGGGAGFGAALFVNQSTALVTVQNTSFLKCSVVGGSGGGSGGNGGGGGLAFPGLKAPVAEVVSAVPAKLVAQAWAEAHMEPIILAEALHLSWEFMSATAEVAAAAQSTAMAVLAAVAAALAG